MPVYSHSQLSTFEQCPLKFKFRYIDKIPKPAEKGVEAFTGSLVHEALQKLYDDLKYQKLNSLEDLLAFYHQQWRRNWHSGVMMVREGLAEENYCDYGAACIRNYYHRHQPFNQSLTLSTEMHLVFQLDEAGQYKFQGYIDRLARRADGTYEIHDYKTSGSLPDQVRIDHDRQLPLYQYGLQTRWRDIESVDLVWHYVGLDSTLVSRRTPEQLIELRQKTIELIDRIESTSDFPPVKSQLCDWCEYRSQCPLWAHVMAVGAMPPDKMAEDVGVRLVNEFAEAKSQADHLDARLEVLRDDILHFAYGRGVRVLAGNGLRLSISEREQVALPSKGEPARDELEAFVRSIGKWEDLSEISASRVAGALENKEWPETWRDRMGKFLRRRKTAAFRLKRCEDRGAAEE
ncbi:MAG: RecB family exonuclease [Terriglobia bacterium]